MLKNLFSKNNGKYSLPEGVRLYAIGDIHGRADLLDQLLTLIAADNREVKKFQLIFLGDYIDRGKNSPAVLDRLIALKNKRPQDTFLKGNHEDCLLEFLKTPEDNIEWLDWGGDETLHAYGVKNTSTAYPDDLVSALLRAMPKQHLDFLNGLETSKRVGDYLFVHAGIKPGTPLEDQTANDMMWIRGEFHRTPIAQRPDFAIIHGHQAGKAVVDKGWRVCVDTGACHSGVLTAIGLEGRKKWFIQTQ